MAKPCNGGTVWRIGIPPLMSLPLVNGDAMSILKRVFKKSQPRHRAEAWRPVTHIPTDCALEY